MGVRLGEGTEKKKKQTARENCSGVCESKQKLRFSLGEF
jgi:hypothetical protein